VNTTRQQGYQFFDVVTQGYVAAVGLLVWLCHGERVVLWPWLVAAHGLGLVLIHLLLRRASRPGAGSWLDITRHFYPVLLFPVLYRESEYLNQMFVSGYLDPAVIRLEEQLFGFQPSLVFMERMPWLVLSESFYAAYFSYYVMITGLSLYLFLCQRGAFSHFLSVVSFIFCVCYGCFIFLPVIGPRLFFGEVAGYTLPESVMPSVVFGCPPQLQSGWFYQIMAAIYDHLEGAGGSLPSSHVAVAVCTVWFSFRYARPIRYVHLAAVSWMCLATVYCRYHYVVDVLAGLGAAAVLIAVGHWGHAWFCARDPERRRTNA
jgi:membrane-associated phospholipid phosphatase